ncbi:MAG: leucine-rich repeat domain-containing protein [Lachnospiraceae bacterium]|nr:leucine-rich repeat domain-containing protein [Lachnospiraceae bacterium]
MKKGTKKRTLIIACVIATILTACGNISGGNKEQSTRTPNSVVGRWYQYEGDGWLKVWVFQDNGVYYSASEEVIDKEDETLQIARRRYKIDGDKIILDGMEATLEYTDYGFYIKYVDAIYGDKFCEYRQDALESSDDYYTSDKYIETLKDENGCVIEDGVLIKYYTNEREITIPDNVTELAGFVIETELEKIDKLTIPGGLKEIGASAFSEIPLGVVMIEEGVEEIGTSAFEDSYFDEIYIPASVKNIGDKAFANSEGNPEGKIYVKKGSYADEYFETHNKYSGTVIVLDE